MQKRLVCLMSFLYLLPGFFGCQRVPAPTESEIKSNKENFDSSLISTPPSQPKKDLQEFWDVNDVDISYIQPNRKLIALTFDDAPKNTLENILAVFANYNAKNPDCKATATVFCNGQYITDSSRHTLEAAATMGFELGNHTYSHYDLTSLNKERLLSEIERTDTLLEPIDHKPRHLLRPPYGKCNAFIQENVSTPIINWTIDTLDWTKASEEEIYNEIVENCYNGCIVLMHDGYPNTVDALKRLLPTLKASGYQAVGVSAMAKANNCPLKNGGEYIRARPKSPNRVRVE
ncbi:MAG: polysaccharide deacetylase family protein [Clostridiales bacterium]|nr:polysaccharide deacetylase family protein [Clostridiales bacterium]